MITPITRKQREALFRVFQRDWPSHITPFLRWSGGKCKHCGKYSGTLDMASIPYKRFRRTVVAYPDSSGCVMIPWHGMMLGIETDGYTHS